MRQGTLTAAVLMVAICAGQTDAASILSLGEFDVIPGAEFTVATAISADGCVVVGEAGDDSDDGWTLAFRWTATEGFVALGHLAEEHDYNSALAVSTDGSVIVGAHGWSFYGDVQAVRWTADGGSTSLGYLPGGRVNDSSATVVSADGSVVAGRSFSALVSGTGTHPGETFRWTEQDGMVGLGTLPGSSDGNAPGAITADGSAIFGTSRYDRAFHWTAADGMVPLDISGARVESIADVSPDGSVVVGTLATKPIQAFRWTEKEGLTLMFDPPLVSYSRANAVSADGSIVVGTTNWGTEDYAGAFIWDAEHGARPLEQMLATDCGLDLTGWRLDDAVDISADGRVILGNSYGLIEAPWIATIPEPSSLVLLGMGATAMLASVCRKRRAPRAPKIVP